jgi:putative cell wall-binding protein
MKKDLRRVGIVGLSTLVVTSMMTLTAGASFAAAGDYAAVSHPNVLQGQAGQPAGNLTLELANGWTTGATQTFTIAGNNCSTAAGIAAAVSFSSVPNAAVARGTGTDPTDTAPNPSKALTGSSASCITAGVNDKLTLTQALPATGTGGDTFVITLSGITYNVGVTAATGNVSVTTAGGLVAVPTPSATVVNAVVVNASFTNTAKVAALPAATGVSLGTQTFTESTAGAYFPPAPQTVVLTLNNGATFTNGVTPTITAPAGYAATHPVTAGTSASYTFTVTGIGIPVKATVTVSGLTADVPNATYTETISAAGMNGHTGGPLDVINVLNFAARTGGATRYDTAAALFTAGGFTSTGAVLASGENFPDALSANYLAGRLGTGTLLTTPLGLSQATLLALLSSHTVTTVYITGGTAAVSQAVQDQIDALHQQNNPALPLFITVRLGGADRYATNQLVNEYHFAVTSTSVLLASGANWPDALSAGPIAVGKQMPLIITRGTTLGGQEMSQLSDFHPTNVVIAGGTLVVSQAIQDQLTAAGYTVLRLAGADRTQTAAAVATWATVGAGATPGTPAITAPQGYSSSTTYISRGDFYADALAAGPVAGKNLNLILLSGSPTVVGSGIPSYLGLKTVGGTTPSPTQVGTLNALGLTQAVSPGLMQAAAATINVP